MGSAGRELTISLDAVRDKNVMQLKKLNTALFPVHYNDKYYQDAIASGEFTKLGLFRISLFLFFEWVFLLIVARVVVRIIGFLRSGVNFKLLD